MNIYNEVHNIKTKYKEGLIQSEIDEVLEKFPDVSMDMVNKELMGSTYLIENNEAITYRGDIVLAITCILENRNPTEFEWD